MNTCSISVAPMPSTNACPVAACQACQVGSGRVSPAETHTRRLDRSTSPTIGSIARYAVGAVKRQVTRWRSMAFRSSGGAADSSNRELAPNRSGKISNAPSPKVKANGGLPAKTSAGVGCTIDAQKESAIASTSR